MIRPPVGRPRPPVRNSRQVPLRLTQIKLAGFKSFVDPTAIVTPGQLVGIVGPNGCGKSNVIDAVRWVLGESKASALRGESMQDVIFNGAGERKPVGRASVELAFDNSAGRIGGQWGRYAEISIKRVLTREEDSSYYINNIPVLVAFCIWMYCQVIFNIEPVGLCRFFCMSAVDILL